MAAPSVSVAPVRTNPHNELVTSPVTTPGDTPSTPEASEATPNANPGDNVLNNVVDAVVADVKKKRRKRRGKSAKNGNENGNENGNSEIDAQLERDEREIQGEDADAWRARASLRLKRLSQIANQLKSVEEELKVATERATDAEDAEALVNKGLRSAHSLIAERDRTLTELKNENGNMRAEVAQLTDDKKKNEKRLLLLKTVSANLHEARDARDAMEKRLDEVMQHAEGLKKTISGRERTISELRVVEAELGKRNVEVLDLREYIDKQAAENKVQRKRAVGMGAAGMLAVCIAMRILTSGKRREENSF